MRYLNRPEPTPTFIENKDKWLKAFMDSKDRSPWRNKSIKTPFLKASEYKCTYCEITLYDKETGYNENVWPNIDHFYPKEKYPLKALDWDNFLPVCSMCNSAKSSKEVVGIDGQCMVINPFDDDTRKVFAYDDGTLQGLNKKAINTLLLIGYHTRSIANQEIMRAIKQEAYYLEENIPKREQDFALKNELIEKVKVYLSRGCDKAPFCTYCATYISQKKSNRWLITELKEDSGFWNENLEILWQQCLKNSFILRD